MNHEQAVALGERWITANGGWTVGMLALCKYDALASCRVVKLTSSGKGFVEVGNYDAGWSVPIDGRAVRHWFTPDLRDPATRGAALEVVRKRWGIPSLYLEPSGAAPDIGWTVCERGIQCSGPDPHPSEAVALVAALELLTNP